ncbi:hypothetical protein FO519_009215 [Halicephalobus sp. NKZ332]|nr:hypothetical protein FO519_009215 [Halicephalobus sp. NKZ332]
MEVDHDKPSSLSSTTFTFSTPFPSSSYRFIEVSKDLAEKFKSGEKLIARGNGTSNMTLCTREETFRCRDVEITNTMLLTEKIEPGDSREYTIDDLFEVIQFSEEEIKRTLMEMPIVEIDGTLRYLCRNVRSFLLNTLVESLDDESIPGINLEKVTFEDLREQFDENIDDCFVFWVLRTYANPDSSINPMTISRDRAVIVLEKEHEISQESFNRQMLTLLPVGLDFDPESLKGIAIINESIVRGKMYDYVNVEDLPSSPKNRLDLLFKIKNSWLLEEIEPYVIDFCPNKTAVMPFLLKYCQQVKKGSNKVFVKRDDDF